MLAILIRILLFIVLLFGLQRLLRRWLQPQAMPQDRHKRTFSTRDRSGTVDRGTMPRDPVCGAYVDEQLALPLRSGQTTYYFCSEECRQKFMEKQHIS